MQTSRVPQLPRVLVVDDSRVVRKIVEVALWRERIEVVTATDGISALAAVSDAQPNLILLDILLPHMDGYQICQVVRHHHNDQRLPIVMLSSKDSVLDRMRGKLAGATDYISKPFEAAELVWTVKRYLSAFSSGEHAVLRGQGMLPAPSSAPTPDSTPRSKPKPRKWWQRK